MPLHPDFQKIKSQYEKKYGDRGEEVFYKWIQKHGLDDTKPLSKQKSKLKSEADDFDLLIDFLDEIDQDIHDKQEEATASAAPNKRLITVPTFKTHYTAAPKSLSPDGPLRILATVLEEGVNVNNWRVALEEFPRVAEQYKTGKQLRLNHGKNVEDVIGVSVDARVLNGSEVFDFLGRTFDGINPQGKYVVAEFEANPKDPQVRTNILHGYVEAGSIGLEADALCNECGTPIQMVGEEFQRQCKHIDAPIKLINTEVKEYSYVAEPAFQHTKAFPGFAAAVNSLFKENSSINNASLNTSEAMTGENKVPETPTPPKVEATAKADVEGVSEAMKAHAEAVLAAYKQGQTDARKAMEHDVEEKKKVEASASVKTDQVTKVQVEAAKSEPDPAQKLFDVVYNPQRSISKDIAELLTAAAKAPKAPMSTRAALQGVVK